MLADLDTEQSVKRTDIHKQWIYIIWNFTSIATNYLHNCTLFSIPLLYGK